MQALHTEAHPTPPSSSHPVWKFSGQDFERMILGSSAEFVHVDHLDYTSSIVMTRNTQKRQGKLCPDTPAARALYESVRKAFTPPRRNATLEFHSAISTALDQKHRVDCFFWYDGSIVTIDLTTLPPGEHIGKTADFVLTPDVFFKKPHNELDHKLPPNELDLDRIKKAGTKIAEVLLDNCRIEGVMRLRKELFVHRRRPVSNRTRILS